MRSTLSSRLALALLSVLGVFVPMVEASTVDEVTIDGTRREKSTETPRTLISTASPERHEPSAALAAPAPTQPDAATPKRFLLHRAWLN